MEDVMFVKQVAQGALAAAIVLGASNAFAGTGPAPNTHDHTHTPEPTVEVGVTKVSGNVSVVMGTNGFAGGNVGVSSGTDGALIVDDLLPGFEQRLEAALAGIPGCTDCARPKYLINTHWHFDHVGTNDHFGGPAVLIAHDTVRPLLAAPQEFKFLGMKFEPKSEAGLPDISFAQKASLQFNGERIELAHFPASHTTGDIVAYFTASNVLHTGDLFFNGMFPFIDFEHGGKVKGMIKSVEKLLADYPDDVAIIPGHGVLAGKAELRTYLAMLKETTRSVETAKAKGMALEDIQNMGLDPKWQSWNWVFVDTKGWIAMVYNSL